MKHSEFQVGKRFRTSPDGYVYICTDIGRRVIVGSCLSMSRRNDWARGLSEKIQKEAWKKDPPEVDPAWLTKPPYSYRALGEDVFDEKAQIKCVPWEESE